MSGTVIAIGGFSADHDEHPLHRFIVDAAKRPKPCICHVPLASGDFELYNEFF